MIELCIRVTNGWCMRDLLKQFMKFGVVGLIAFGIDYGLMIVLTEVFSIDYLVSATLSFAASVIFNYFASMRYVFSRKEGMSRRREFTVFIILSVIGLLLNNVLMWVGVELLHVDYRITKIFATFVVTFYNFFSRKKFLEGAPKNADPAVQESDPLH